VSTTAVRRLAPLVVAGVLLAAGYARYAPGVEHAQDQRAYLAFAWEENRYSDIIFLYLRDEQASHPRPYLDDDLEYPVLMGGLSYLLGFAPTLGAYFDLTYAVLAACALVAVALLRRLPGANPWYLAASPALALYTGLNWDLAAVAATVVALVAFDRRRDRWGGVALTAAIWLKFFPLVFLVAILIERLRERRYRAALEVAGVAAVGSLFLNLPLALASFDGWSTFFTFNRDRPPDGNLWVLFRDLSTPTVNLIAALGTAAGGLGAVLLALRSRRPVLLPLGATLLPWWLLLNKVFSPQYAVWLVLAAALLAPSLALWVGLVAVDLAAFHVGFLIQYTVHQPDPYGRPAATAIADWQVRHLYDPIQLARGGIVLLLIGVGLARLARPRVSGIRADGPAAAPRPSSATGGSQA
jgi:hypothetical protein